MNRPLTYQKSVDVLFQGYFDGTLQHGNCYACACGNLVAAANGYKFIPSIDRPDARLVWDVTKGIYSTIGYPVHATWGYASNGEEYVPAALLLRGLQEIKSTGYTPEEFDQIEAAFELADKGNSEEDYMFNGLEAVLNCLKEIHEVEDNSTDLNRFRNHYSTLINQ